MHTLYFTHTLAVAHLIVAWLLYTHIAYTVINYILYLAANKLYSLVAANKRLLGAQVYVRINTLRICNNIHSYIAYN